MQCNSPLAPPGWPPGPSFGGVRALRRRLKELHRVERIVQEPTCVAVNFAPQHRSRHPHLFTLADLFVINHPVSLLGEIGCADGGHRALLPHGPLDGAQRAALVRLVRLPPLQGCHRLPCLPPLHSERQRLESPWSRMCRHIRRHSRRLRVRREARSGEA